MTDPMAQNVDDELAIRNLVARFSDTVNRRDADGLGRLFTPDGTWNVPGMDLVEGPAGVSGLIAQLLGGLPFLMQVTHQGEVRVDGDQGSARWYLQEFAKDADGTGWSFLGTYHDRYVRTDDGWRFGSRRFDFLYRGRVELPGRHYPFPEIEGEWAWSS